MMAAAYFSSLLIYSLFAKIRVGQSADFSCLMFFLIFLINITQCKAVSPLRFKELQGMKETLF